jgi:hypothetical protein
VAQLYPEAPGTLSVAVYDLKGYGGGILTHLLTGESDINEVSFCFKKSYND